MLHIKQHDKLPLCKFNFNNYFNLLFLITEWGEFKFIENYFTSSVFQSTCLHEIFSISENNLPL